MVVPTPIRPLVLVASSTRRRRLVERRCDTRPRRRSTEPRRELRHYGRAILQQAAEELEEYFEGTRRSFDVPLDPVGTPFQQQAWAALRTIPYGETVTYGEQAERLGDRRKARAIGAANGRNPISIIVPCHRVVGSNGALVGFAGGLDVKAWLLDHERRALTPASTHRRGGGGADPAETVGAFFALRGARCPDPAARPGTLRCRRPAISGRPWERHHVVGLQVWMIAEAEPRRRRSREMGSTPHRGFDMGSTALVVGRRVVGVVAGW
jgi:methylated-DNA-[protein]-cysteine S-methyltransferase